MRFQTSRCNSIPIKRLLPVFFMIQTLWLATALAQPIREAAVAGQFYPADPARLRSEIDSYMREAGKTPSPIPESAQLKALIMPHAGYIYSGLTAAHAATALKCRAFSKIIIMGPDHRVGFSNAVISDAAAFQTPSGNVALHPDAARLRKKYPDLFTTNPASDRMEHAIEVILPFLQHVLPEFQMIPVVMGTVDIGVVADVVDTVLDPDTLVVVSSDLSHYLAHDAARRTDQETINWILDLNSDAFAAHPDRACGHTPIGVLLELARRHQWRPVLLHYSTSGDTAGPKDRVVGYAAIAFYEMTTTALMKGSEPMEKEKGDILIRLARKTIAENLGMKAGKADDLATALKDDAFSAKRGTFVTLTINNQLRGCIGNLSPDKSIREGVKDNAINAAFYDPRFPALSQKELDAVDIEISLLTEPRPLAFKDSEDLLARLRPGIDGVIIRKGGRSATFLPQVWDQLPDKKVFLNHLCSKADLPADAWRAPGFEVQVYQVQYFHERH